MAVWATQQSHQCAGLWSSASKEFLLEESHQTLADSAVKVKRMLTGFIKKLKADS
jgi:hypothetical protein